MVGKTALRQNDHRRFIPPTAGARRYGTRRDCAVFRDVWYRTVSICAMIVRCSSVLAFENRYPANGAAPSCSRRPVCLSVSRGRPAHRSVYLPAFPQRGGSRKPITRAIAQDVVRRKKRRLFQFGASRPLSAGQARARALFCSRTLYPPWRHCAV